MSRLIPPGTKIVADYLRADPDVEEIIGRRVVAKTPDDVSAPWVKITQLDAPKRTRTAHLIEFYFQLDCYAGDPKSQAGGQPTADLLARTVCAAIERMDADGPVGEGFVVTAAEANPGLYRPDTDFNPDRERYAATALVWIHSREEGS